MLSRSCDQSEGSSTASSEDPIRRSTRNIITPDWYVAELASQSHAHLQIVGNTCHLQTEEDLYLQTEEDLYETAYSFAQISILTDQTNKTREREKRQVYTKKGGAKGTDNKIPRSPDRPANKRITTLPCYSRRSQEKGGAQEVHTSTINKHNNTIFTLS